MGSGKKRERDSTGGSSGAKEEGETQSLKKAKIEDSTSASEGIQISAARSHVAHVRC